MLGGDDPPAVGLLAKNERRNKFVPEIGNIGVATGMMLN